MDDLINKHLQQFEEIGDNNGILYSKANYFDKKMGTLQASLDDKLNEFIYFRRELGLLPQIHNCVNDIYTIIDNTTEMMYKMEQFFNRMEKLKKMERLEVKDQELQGKVENYRMYKEIEFEKIAKEEM